MKNKLVITILAIVGIILVFIGAIFLFSSPVSKTEKPKKLRKITEEEIAHESALEILEFYLEEQPIEEKIEIKNAKILANTLDGEYLVRIELENTSEDNSYSKKEVTIQYLGDGNWKVNLPLQDTSEIADKYTEFWPEVDEE